MKNAYYWIFFSLVNLLLGGLYLYGADHNRYICALLWFVIPMVDFVIFSFGEER